MILEGIVSTIAKSQLFQVTKIKDLKSRAFATSCYSANIS